MENEISIREFEVKTILDMIGGSIEQELKDLTLQEKEKRLFYLLIQDLIEKEELDLPINPNEDHPILQRISIFLSETLNLKFYLFNPSEFFTKFISSIYKTINLEISPSPYDTLLTFKLISKLTFTNQANYTPSVISRYLDLDLLIFLKNYSDHVHIDTFNQCKSLFPRPSTTFSIIVSKSYHSGKPNTAEISQDKLFQFSFKGKSEYNDRSDNLILIGTSKFCNIILPEDLNLNLKGISVIIYLTYPLIMIQDLNEKIPTLIKINPSKNNEDLAQLAVLKEGDVINLSRLYDFYIEKIKFKQLGSNEKVRLGSSLTIRWINSPLQGQFSKIRTYGKGNKTYVKNIFILGRGGDGIVPDISTLSSITHIGRDQLYFIFQGGNWHILDNYSKNFSFIAIKPYQSSESSPVPLFVSSSQENSFFCIGKKYMFIFRLQ